MKLVSLEEAKEQLSLLESQTFDDERIERLIESASETIMDYIGTDSLAIDSWTDTNGNPIVATDDVAQDVPGPVRHATLLLVARLDRDREGMDGDPLSPAIQSLLARFRDPPIA